MQVIGTSFDFTARYFAERLGEPPERGPELVDEMTETMFAAVQRDVAGRPGALELVARLRGRVPLGLASNSPRRLVDAALASAGLTDVFAAIVTSEDVMHAKPAPDIYLEAARRIGVAPGACVALEDSDPGVRAALGAGMTVFMVPDLVRPSDELARLVPFIVDSLDHAHAHIAGWPE